jgi:phosphatidylinositol glycan class P protein
MEDQLSVSSPRGILSISKRRKGALVSFADSCDGTSASGFGVSSPRTSEVYGFVGSITTIVATVIFLVWAYVPEPWLHSIGIFYYPSRYWALTVIVYAMVTVVLALGFYLGLNLMSTPLPTSLNTLFDEFSREPSGASSKVTGEAQPIQPISDIAIYKVNDLMFGDIECEATFKLLSYKTHFLLTNVVCLLPLVL